MKNILSFIFLFLSLSCASYAQTIDVKDFKVNESIGQSFSSGTRFDFEFKIKGDYTYGTHGHYQVDLILYKDHVSASNEISRSYWNREGDENLFFSSYTRKNWWNTALQGYSTLAGKKFYLVVKYAGLTKILSYTFPVIDVKDFKVNEPSGNDFSSGTRFDFEFKIKGDYTYSTHGHYQVDLILYKDHVSASNEIARSYWNDENDTDLLFSNYVNKTWWNTARTNYSTKPLKKFYLVVKYAGLTKTLSYTYPDIDSDGDGIPNNNDLCPNEFGLVGTGGCPDSDFDGVPDIHDICPYDFYNECLDVIGKDWPKEIIVRDMYGKVIAVKTVTTPEQEQSLLEQLPSGMYFIEDSLGERKKIYKE